MLENANYPWGGKGWYAKYSDGTNRYLYLYPNKNGKWRTAHSAEFELSGHVDFFTSSMTRYDSISISNDYYNSKSAAWFPYEAQPRLFCDIIFWRKASWDIVARGKLTVTQKSNGKWTAVVLMDGGGLFTTSEGNESANPWMPSN